VKKKKRGGGNPFAHELPPKSPAALLKEATAALALAAQASPAAKKPTIFDPNLSIEERVAENVRRLRACRSEEEARAVLNLMKYRPPPWRHLTDDELFRATSHARPAASDAPSIVLLRRQMKEEAVRKKREARAIAREKRRRPSSGPHPKPSRGTRADR
jgi:hypothetical protein